MGYKYLIRSGGTSFTAFRTLGGLRKWLRQRGLRHDPFGPGTSNRAIIGQFDRVYWGQVDNEQRRELGNLLQLPGFGNRQVHLQGGRRRGMAQNDWTTALQEGGAGQRELDVVAKECGWREIPVLSNARYIRGWVEPREGGNRIHTMNINHQPTLLRWRKHG